MAKLGLDLNVTDVKTLLEKYSSDLRVLDFQASVIRTSIQNLENMLANGKSAVVKTIGKAGRPAKHKENADVPEAASTPSTPKRGPGRPRIIPLEDIKVDPNLPPLPKKPKAPKAEKPAKEAKKSSGKKGRKPGFNRWEEAILEMLKSNDRPLKNEDLMDAMHMVAQRDNVQEGTAQLKVRLNQALVKLGNKLKLLNKQSFEGKGYMYSLK